MALASRESFPHSQAAFNFMNTPLVSTPVTHDKAPPLSTGSSPSAVIMEAPTAIPYSILHGLLPQVPAMRVHIMHMNKVETAQTFHFLQSVVCIGRSSDNDLLLRTPLRMVGQHHIKIVRAVGKYWLLDHGTNTTWCNQQRVGTGQRLELFDNDVIQIGDFCLTFQALGSRLVTRARSPLRRR